jgi:hypothetical protein
MSIKLELDINEVNAVLQSLGAQQYTAVAAIIEKIKMQAIPQVAEQEAAAKVAAESAPAPTAE